jgi:hypothetical protein
MQRCANPSSPSFLLNEDILRAVATICRTPKDVSALGNVSHGMDDAVRSVGIQDPALSHFGIAGTFGGRIEHNVHVPIRSMIVADGVLYAAVGKTVFTLDDENVLQRLWARDNVEGFDVRGQFMYIMTSTYVVRAPLRPDRYVNTDECKPIHTLPYASVSGASVSGASVSGASVSGASVSGASVSGAAYKALAMGETDKIMYLCSSGSRERGYNITKFEVYPDHLQEENSFWVDTRLGDEQKTPVIGTQARARQHMSYDDVDDRLLLFDSLSCRVLVISTTGDFVCELKPPGEKKLGRSSQVVRAWGEYIVTNSDLGEIYRYSIRGTYTNTLALMDHPTTYSQFRTKEASAIAFSPGVLYVAEGLDTSQIAKYL